MPLLFWNAIAFLPDRVSWCWFLSQDNLTKQEARLKIAEAELNDAQAILDDKERQLSEVQQQYDDAISQKQVCLLVGLFFTFLCFTGRLDLCDLSIDEFGEDCLGS